MSKTKSLFIVAVAVSGIMMISGECWAQGFASYGPATSVVEGSLSYPAGALYKSFDNGADYGEQGAACPGRSGNHPRWQELKSKYAHAEKNCARVIARNEAWPMPFNCASRQLYFTFWEPMIDQGFEEQCVLTSAHFDDETGELNSFGTHTVAGIMQNMPSARRKVFIHRDVDVEANEARLAAVKKTINTFYGQSGPAMVEFSTKLPVKLRGSTAETIFQLSNENRPNPVIPISTVGSVNSSVGN
jgi:hypothetical protein